MFNLSAAWNAEFAQPEIISGWYALSINNKGQIAGSAETVNGSQFALTWDSTNGLRVFSDMGGATSSYCINNLGQIAIDGYPGDFLWDANTGLKQINGWGNGPLSPVDINDLGQVVGSHWPDNDLSAAFFWDGDVAMEIGDLGGETACACAINNSGRVVGCSQLPDGTTQAFIWDTSNVTRNIGVGCLGSIAIDINDQEQILGIAQLEAYDDWHAVLWEDNIMIDLDVLIGTSFSASAINNSGQIIGYATTIDGMEDDPRVVQYAAIWDKNIGMCNLNDLISSDAHCRISSASAINDNGWIVATAFDTDSGQCQKVLLKPVPEPTAAAILPSFLLTCGICSLKRYYY